MGSYYLFQISEIIEIKTPRIIFCLITKAFNCYIIVPQFQPDKKWFQITNLSRDMTNQFQRNKI